MKLIYEDMNYIFEEWDAHEKDCKIIFPDQRESSFQREAKMCAFEGVCFFLMNFCANKKLELGIELFPTIHEITKLIAKMYYQTTNEKFKNNAMDVLQLINSSERYS